MNTNTSNQSVRWYRKPGVWIRRLYDWTLSWADSKYAMPALFVLAFVEASFFPIPPDVLLMALCLGRPTRSLGYALVCTAGSVSGAILGWGIGAGLWASMGEFSTCPEYAGGALFFESVPGFTCEAFGKVKELYEDNAWMALFTAAFTPIPYKIFTIAAGVFHVEMGVLIAASVVGRGTRFGLVAGLIYFFGPQVKGFIEKRFEVLTIVFTILLIGGFVAIKYLL